MIDDNDFDELNLDDIDIIEPDPIDVMPSFIVTPIKNNKVASEKPIKVEPKKAAESIPKIEKVTPEKTSKVEPKKAAESIPKIEKITPEKTSKVEPKKAAESIPKIVVEEAPEKTELEKTLAFYRKLNPEAAICRRKEYLARKLLTVSVDELKTAPDQPWYDEYLALLRIRLQEPALLSVVESIRAELLGWYSSNSQHDSRELAILGLLQFVEPVKLTVPFNQHLWHPTMISDVKGVFLGYFTRVSYVDDDITTYYLARQAAWRHGRRKLRIAFLLNSNSKSECSLPVYDALRQRDDVDAHIVLHSTGERKFSHSNWNWLHQHYPDDKIYDISGLGDLRRLKPDYVFFRTPYESRRNIPELTVRNIMTFAKVVHMSYGITLAQSFLDRLFDQGKFFYPCAYAMFCTGESVRQKMIERFADNVDVGYQHFLCRGYGMIDHPPLPMPEHSKPTILWTPRWSYNARVGGSHFLEYKDKFVGLRQRYGNRVNLATRPHVNTFGDLQKLKLITKDDVDAYKKSLKDNNITLYARSFDLEENFSRTDILLSDYSSILPVFFVTGRPIIYCEFPNAVFFPEYREMLECMYVAHNWTEVEHYLDELVNGNDPLRDRRRKAAAKLREYHADAGKRIAEWIINDFNACETTARSD